MRLISNTELLDKDKDKNKIAEMQKQKQKDLKNVNYPIDLNTGKVKTNDSNIFIVDKDTNIKDSKSDSTIYKQVKDDYLQQMQYYKITASRYLNKTYKSKRALNKDILAFNTDYDKDYYNGFNLRVRDFLDEDIKASYLKNYASALLMVQMQEVNKIGIDAFIKLDLDNCKDFNKIIDIQDLKDIQSDLINQITEDNNKKELDRFIDDFNRDDLEFLISDIMLKVIYKHQETNLNALIKSDADYYTKIHNLYAEINNIILEVVNGFKSASDKLDEDKKTDITAPKPKAPKNKELSLYATKIFNNIYNADKDTLIDLHNDTYTLKMRLIVDEINDLRDIILYDEIHNNIVKLYPIDLALFLGFTNINNLNGANIPITINDAIKYIAENSGLKIKKGNKQLKLYEDRLLLYNNTKVKAQVIKRTEDNKDYILFENKDLISILENKRIWINNRADMGYLIGASAILTIINTLSKDSGIDYLATFKNANKYINDKQNNTIAILNMKYYILPKILQMVNAKDKGNIFNPVINLDELFNQLADLQGKKELSRQEKARVREQIDKYLKHLTKKGLLSEYNYMTADKKVLKNTDDIKGLTKPITHLKIRIQKADNQDKQDD